MYFVRIFSIWMGIIYNMFTININNDHFVHASYENKNCRYVITSIENCFGKWDTVFKRYSKINDMDAGVLKEVIFTEKNYVIEYINGIKWV